jgi:ABC-type uncharacterized transport system substrate-binding protein
VDGTPPALVAKAATTKVPIVFTLAGDPVGSGLVASFAHPGGNVTGVSNFRGDLSGKQLQSLKELVPQLAPVAVLYNPLNPVYTVWTAREWPAVGWPWSFGFWRHWREAASVPYWR